MEIIIEKRLLLWLKKDLREGGRFLGIELIFILSFEFYFENLIVRYINLLKDNIIDWFLESFFVLFVFKIFDLIVILGRLDEFFKEYGIREINILVVYFY